MTLPAQPTLTTERLVLRPFAATDAARVSELAGDRDVAATTLRIPHPYTTAMAEEWVATLAPMYAEERGEVFAVTIGGDDLIGAVGLSLHLDHRRAELGYWIGKPYWGRGYATEAARAVVTHGFRDLGLHRIHAHYMSTNPASGAVMRKLGMQYEGILRHHTFKNGEFFDVECFGVLEGEGLERRA